MLATTPFKFCLASAALLLGAAGLSQAAIIVVAPTTTTGGSITITQDITLIATVAGNACYLILDEWVVSNGSLGPSYLPNTKKFVYSLNGAPDKTGASSNHVLDNMSQSVGDITPNDGYISFDSTSVGNSLAIGETFTLRSGTYTLDPDKPAFNPMATQTFTGNVYLAGGHGERLSANTPLGAVPEPSTTLLGALAGLTLLRRRRR